MEPNSKCPHNTILTEQQIKNWRTALIPIFGPYALIMPADKIQLFRDLMQDKMDKISKKMEMEQVQTQEKKPTKKPASEPFNAPRIVKK